MIKNFAKFTATMGKGIKVGDSDVEIKLTLPLKVVQENFLFLSTNQGEKINVFLGDPQMAFDFDEDDDDAYKLYQGGRRVTADASGVVTSVEQKDENQAELNLEESGSEGATEHNDGQADDPEGTQPPAEDGDNDLDEYEKEIMGEGSTKEGSDLPQWMQEQQHEESGSQEMNFEENDQGQDVDGASDTEVSQASSDVEISKEDLEQFILKERPSFDEIPLDFPLFLEKRLKEGKTWSEISRIAGITSSQLQPKWKKYKEMVTKMMKDGGAA